MNALTVAKEALTWLDGTSTDDFFLAKAQAYAAIAQAEQLKRIGDALEVIAHPNRIVAPDPQDYYREDDYNQAAEQYDFNRNSHRGEGMSEYRARRDGGDAIDPVGPSPLDNF